MKYKVTITSQDLTGHEDVEVHENLSEEQLKLTIDYNNGKSILIEPTPERQKVTVWFYLCKNNIGLTYSASNTDKMTIVQRRDNDVSLGHKVSEIYSMEVEI
jgi:hypothetical protein